MVQILRQLTKLHLRQLLLILLRLQRLSLSKLYQGLTKLGVLLLESLQFVFTLVKVMNVFTHEKATKYTLYCSCMLGKVSQIFLVKIPELLLLKLFPGVISPELCLNSYRCIPHSFKLLSFHVHFKFRLNLQSRLIVSAPVLLSLISRLIVKLDR